MKKSNQSESKIQSTCIKWLWNSKPETRGLMFSIRNEDDGITVYDVVNVLKEIIKTPSRAVFLAKAFISEIQSKKSRRGGLLNAMGRVAGVADTCLLWSGKAYFIEFKDEKGRQSKDQKAWEAKAAQAGFNYFIIRDLCSFQELIHNITTYAGS